MIPFVIHAIGDRWYGFWVLVGSLVGYYGFFELGISTANERFIARALGKGDKEELNRVFNTSLFIFILIGLTALLLSFLLILICPRFIENPDDVKIFRIVILFVGINNALSFPIRGFYGFLYAHVRYDIVNIFGILKLTLRTALIIFFLNRGHGIIALAVITLAVDLLQYFLTIRFTILNYPNIKISIREASRDIVRMLLGYSIFSFIANIAKQLRFYFATFIISAYLGLSLVTHYNIGGRVAEYYMLLVASAIALMKPVFSSLEGKGDFDKIRSNYIFMVKLNTIISIFLGGSILIYGKVFITRWMGIEFLDSWNVLLILTVGLIFSTIQVTPVTLLYSISKHKFYAIAMVIEGIANILLSNFLT